MGEPLKMSEPLERHSKLGAANWMVAWITSILILLTFAVPAAGSAAGEMNSVSYIKLAARLISIALLSIFVLCNWNRRRNWTTLSLFVPLSIFVAFAITSTLWSPLRNVSFGQSISLLALVLLCAAHAILVRNDEHFSLIMGVLNTSILLVVSCALFVHVALPSLGRISRDSNGLLHATNAAASASVGLLILLASNVIWRWAWSRWLLVPGVLVYFAVILVAVNRWAPLVTVPIVGLMLLIFVDRTIVAMFVVATSLLITCCVAIDPTLSLAGEAVPLAETYAKRGQSNEQLSKFSGRQEMWWAMWKSHLDSPWIGHGYFVTSRAGRIEVWNDVGNRTAHNMMLQVLVTCGRVGLLLFVCGLVWPIFHIGVGLSGRFGDWRLLVFLSLMLMWYLGWGLLNESIAGPVQPESIVFYSLFGIAVGVSERRRKVANYCKGYACIG